MNPVLAILGICLLVLTFGGFLLLVARLLGSLSRGRQSSVKEQAYECGINGEVSIKQSCVCALLFNGNTFYYF